MSILEVRNLSKYFGGLAAISDLDFVVSESEIHGLIGPNGAGKTTLFNVITGFYPPTKGSVIFRGEDITELKPHQIAQRGIVRTFQQTALFMGSTVLANVLVGFHMSCRAGVLREFLHTHAATEVDQRMTQEALEIIELMGLDPLRYELAANLPHGNQRTLGVCMALACHPSLLLLDEPVTGMNPVETETMIDQIRKIRDRGITIVMVEHDMRAVMNVCDRITVLNYGRKIAEGLPHEISENKEVIEAYLGREGG